jgi:hypothetical protein
MPDNILCPCGARFCASLGKYGCPNCLGETMTDRPPPRTRDVRVRLSAEEKALVEALAREERLTVSDLIRERLGLPLMVSTA